MASREDLKEILARINEKGYKAYKDIEGSYDFGIFVLSVDHVQGDPFAAPSRLRVADTSRESRIPVLPL